MGSQIKSNIFQTLGPKITDSQSSKIAYNTVNAIPTDIPESETKEATGASSAGSFSAPLFGDMKEENENLNDLDFFKSSYESESKKFIAAYYIVDDSSDKFIEILNIQEIYPRKSTFGDEAEPYLIKIRRIKLPKSQINILDQDTGFENFKFIEIPYWLVKKNIDDFKIMRKDIFKRIVLDKLSKDEVDKDVINYIKTTDKDNNSQKWIESFGNSRNKNEKKMDMGENWSEKYKKSIDCDNPKGFSQKAHCQGKIKKTETKEATGSSSSGSYVTPMVWAKSSTKKNWRGAKKTQIPGGKFVEVKRKCQKYPYCNQGDIKALKIFENERIKEVIKNVSKKHNISESVIKNILRDNLHIFRNYKK